MAFSLAAKLVHPVAAADSFAGQKRRFRVSGFPGGPRTKLSRNVPGFPHQIGTAEADSRDSWTWQLPSSQPLRCETAVVAILIIIISKLI